MVLGAVLMLAALSLFWKNQREERMAEDSAQEILPKLIQDIEEQATKNQKEKEQQQTGEGQQNAENDYSYIASESDDASLNPFAPTTKEIKIDGNTYIGYLTIPSRDLILPVMANWSYKNLRIAPCRYSGDVASNNLVIAAHNYSRHFGELSKLSIGDKVTFTGLDGVVISYEVAVVDILAPTAVIEMIEGEYDLTLFTCTYGGKSRVTVRCERI